MTFPPSLPIPDEVLAIARRLEDAGYETWCVGGAVRDNLLKSPNKDFDLATSARPDRVRSLFKRTIPLGVEHGTVAVLDQKNQSHEVTTFRRDVRTDGRHAVVEFGASLVDDLARRDFTINAIAYHPFTHEWRDPFSGAVDLETKTIRGVGDPTLRFREDYLRILRALRFSARFGFTIEPATYEAATANVDGLSFLSAERVREEWFLGLKTAEQVAELVDLWLTVGAMAVRLPEFRADARERGPVLNRMPRDPVLITSYLSRDPVTTLTNLRCANAEIERGRAIERFRSDRPDPASGGEVRRWLSRTGAIANDLLKIDEAEGRAVDLAAAVEVELRSNPPLSAHDLAIDGNELMELGVRQGPAIGVTLQKLLDAVLEDPSLNEPNQLRGMVMSLDVGDGVVDAEPASGP